VCLAIPALVVSIDREIATIQVGGLKQQCSLTLVPEARVGDYVIVHAGYAISMLDQEEAQITLDLFRQLGEIPDGNDAAIH
jgi:hydrogenase expression/formation protein HypC